MSNDQPTHTPLIGAHLSITGGFRTLKSKMDEIGATCCAFFLKNQKRFVGKELDPKDVAAFKVEFDLREKEDKSAEIVEENHPKRQRTDSDTEKHEQSELKSPVSEDEQKLERSQDETEEEKSSQEKLSDDKITTEKSSQNEFFHKKESSKTSEEKTSETQTNKNSSSSCTRSQDILVPHASYLINMANNTEKRSAHLDCFWDELERCTKLGIKYINIHPGSDTSKIGKVKSCQLIADVINEAHLKFKNVVILLENMAGQGNVLCSKFEELKMIIDGVNDKSRVGVCIDTAHLWGAGYDFRTKEKYEKLVKQIDEIVGLSYIKAFHLNDSKVELNSKKDRHEQIGKGFIGLDAFKFIMSDKRFVKVPKILETPDESKYKEEIELLKGFAQGDH